MAGDSAVKYGEGHIGGIWSVQGGCVLSFYDYRAMEG